MQKTPYSVLLAASFLAFGLVAVPAFAAPPPFTTTELISGANLPVINGNNLFNAVAVAGPGTLIKLEPGFYDLSGRQIVLPDFVDIEGSGRDITTVFSDLSAAATPTLVDVAPGINGELRELTLFVRAENATGVTVRSDELLLTEVNLELEAERRALGVRIDGASPRLDEVFVRILGAGGNGIGFQVEGGGGPVLFSNLFFASNVQRQAIGVLIDEASPIIEGSIFFALFNGANTGILVSGETTEATIRNVRAVIQGDRAIGVEMQKLSNARIKESSFFVRSDDFAAGIQLEEASAKATETTFNAASLFGFNPNVWGALLRGPANFDSNQSNYESSSFAVQNAGSGQARFGASQLVGAAVPAVFGPLVCAQSYNGAYAPVNNFCN